MRLEPIDRAPTWKGRIASWWMRRQLGAVIMPARVIYNRIPGMYDVSWSLLRLHRSGFRLPLELRLLVQTWVAMVNECRFCVDIARAAAVMERIGLLKLEALPAWRTSPRFDARERAALAYAEEATRQRRVSDETFEALRKEFSDHEIAELTVLNAIENFYNLLNVPLGIEADGLCALAEARRA